MARFMKHILDGWLFIVQFFINFFQAWERPLHLTETPHTFFITANLSCGVVCLFVCSKQANTVETPSPILEQKTHRSVRHKKWWAVEDLNF